MRNMKRFQIKFSSQFLAIFLLVTRVKSKKICNPGQQDLTSQPFDLTARGECGVLDDISRGNNSYVSGRNCSAKLKFWHCICSDKLKIWLHLQRQVEILALHLQRQI
jgi:hypothetical protein